KQPAGDDSDRRTRDPQADPKWLRFVFLWRRPRAALHRLRLRLPMRLRPVGHRVAIYRSRFVRHRGCPRSVALETLRFARSFQARAFGLLNQACWREAYAPIREWHSTECEARATRWQGTRLLSD